MNRASLRGTPCQFVRPERARLHGAEDYCGQPSRFVWRGFDPSLYNKTKAQLKKHVHVDVFVCVDCALELMANYGWHIKDGKARLERMDVTKFRGHCKACGTTAWIAWDHEVPQTYPGTHFSFCPRCGERSVFMVDQLQDVWEVMSEDLAGRNLNFPIQLLKMLYEDWPNCRKRFWKFYDYVQYQMDCYERTGEFDMAEA